MVLEIDNEESYAVKRLAEKNIRASLVVYQNTPQKLKARFHRQMAMEYPVELGPKAIKLVQPEKCLP